MDDSFSLLGLDRELCERVLEEPVEELEIKHFVFEDLLDSQERLVCRKVRINESFEVFGYVLEKTSRSIFGKHTEELLGCCLGYSGGSIFSFEDLNFKIQSFDNFSLVVEAVEVTTGTSLYFELCNLCELPESAPQEMDIALSLYSASFHKLSPLSRLDQIAEENRDVLKLAVKGNEKAVEKLEREIGEEEARRLLREFTSMPHKLFDTCILQMGVGYTIIGIVTSVRELNLSGAALTSVDVIAEDLNFNILFRGERDISDGDRIKAEGKFYGLALFEQIGGA